MTRIDIELPESMKAYLEEESRRRGYAGPSEFVQSLLEAEQHRHSNDAVPLDADTEAAIREGLDSPASPWTSQDVEHIRAEGRRLIELRKQR